MVLRCGIRQRSRLRHRGRSSAWYKSDTRIAQGDEQIVEDSGPRVGGFGPENRYSHTSAGVFPTRGPTWGKALRKTTQMTSSSADAMANPGARNRCSSYRGHFGAPEPTSTVSRSLRPRNEGVSQAGEQSCGDSHSPRPRDVVRRLRGRQGTRFRCRHRRGTHRGWRRGQPTARQS